MEIEKTKHFTYKDKMIPVDEFSKEVRKEIEFYDYLREKLVFFEREMKVYVTAFATQQAKIQKLIKDEIAASEPAPTPEPPQLNDN
jgi:hypothetical protein